MYFCLCYYCGFLVHKIFWRRLKERQLTSEQVQRWKCSDTWHKKTRLKYLDINRLCDIKESFEFSLRGDDPLPTVEWQKLREELRRDFSLLCRKLILIIARGVYFNSSFLQIPSGITSYNDGKTFNV